MIYTKSGLSAAAMILLMGGVSFAQGGGPMPGERVDAQGMPTTRSTPAEQAETARINNQVGAKNAAMDAKAAADDAQYQAQQKQYQAQLRQNRAQQEQNQAQQQDYQDRTAAYNNIEPLCCRTRRLSSRRVAEPPCEMGDRGSRRGLDR